MNRMSLDVFVLGMPYKTYTMSFHTLTALLGITHWEVVESVSPPVQTIDWENMTPGQAEALARGLAEVEDVVRLQPEEE